MDGVRHGVASSNVRFLPFPDMSVASAFDALQTLARGGRLRQMSTRALLLIGSLLLGGFAVAVVVANTAPEPTGTIVFHGSERSLTILSAEATRCGLRQTKVEKIGKFLALTVRTSGVADTRATCLVRWVLAHPEAKIGFLGNQALASESKP